MTIIRVAQPRDAAAISAIYAPYVLETTFTFEYVPPTPEEFLGRMETIQKTYPWLVLEQDGVVVGYAYASPYNQRAAYGWIADLSIYLSPDCRGKGQGGRLFECLMELARLQGVRTVYGIVTDPNPVSYRFNLKHGLKPVGHFHNAGFKLGKWLGVDFLEKALAPSEGTPEPITPFPQMDNALVEQVLTRFSD